MTGSISESDGGKRRKSAVSLDPKQSAPPTPVSPAAEEKPTVTPVQEEEPPKAETPKAEAAAPVKKAPPKKKSDIFFDVKPPL